MVFNIFTIETEIWEPKSNCQSNVISMYTVLLIYKKYFVDSANSHVTYREIVDLAPDFTI